MPSFGDKENLIWLFSPHCPVEKWWDLAAYFPLEALRSPLGPLLLLEEPHRWRTLEERCASRWSHNTAYYEMIYSPDKEAIAETCVAKILPYYTETWLDVWPRDQFLRCIDKNTTDNSYRDGEIQTIRGRLHQIQRVLPQVQDAIAYGSLSRGKQSLEALGLLLELKFGNTLPGKTDNRILGDLFHTMVSFAQGMSLKDQYRADTEQHIWNWHLLLSYLQKGRR